MYVHWMKQGFFCPYGLERNSCSEIWKFVNLPAFLVQGRPPAVHFCGFIFAPFLGA